MSTDLRVRLFCHKVKELLERIEKRGGKVDHDYLVKMEGKQASRERFKSNHGYQRVA